jgi:AcrR family transcriptional regulator
MTRQRIIEKAAPLFNQRGFSGCSMQDVMEATGLEKGGLYRHFKSKQELAIEALRYALSATNDAHFVDLSTFSSATEKMLYLVARFIEVPSPLPGGCPLLNTAIDADDSNPALRAVAQQGLSGWKLRLEKIVQDGIVSGEISAQIEPRRVANAFIATLEGSLVVSRLEGKRTAMRDAQKTLEIMIKSLRSGG